MVLRKKNTIQNQTKNMNGSYKRHTYQINYQIEY